MVQRMPRKDESYSYVYDPRHQCWNCAVLFSVLSLPFSVKHMTHYETRMHVYVWLCVNACLHVMCITTIAHHPPSAIHHLHSTVRTYTHTQSAYIN